MIIIPAVDISSGKCVRLSQGRKEEKKEYSDNPVETALKWEEQGAKLIHLVDLDRAIDGSDVNVNVIAGIIKALKIPVELGGGMRSINDIDRAVSMGVARVIIGTSAIENRRFVQEALEKFNERIIIGIDAKDDYVAVKGWKEVTKIKLLELVLEMENIGVKRIIYTDIKRDGMMTGPNVNVVNNILNVTNLYVIASGGVSSIEDIKKLKLLNHPRLEGVIVGKALYEGKFSLKEALLLTEF